MSHDFEPEPHEKAMIDVMLKSNSTPSWVYEFNKFLIEERTTGELINFVADLLRDAAAEERERIEAVFKKHVPTHAMDLEDAVWLKRLLNKAFHYENIH